MATMPYTQSTAAYIDADYASRDSGYGSHRAGVGATIATWVFWAIAAAFWGASLTTGVGIVQSVMSYRAPVEGGVDAGGVGFFLMDVIGGVVVLGLALAYGVFRNATRDKRNDPVTEAATHELYDTIEREGGEDLTTRSPEARSATERDAYRSSEGDLR